MGTTLTGTTPQDTYDSLIKVTDNGPLSGTAKYLSDGLGNDSALAVSTTAVGIGTATPARVLDVNDSLRVSVAGPNRYFDVTEGTIKLYTSAFEPSIKFGDYNTGLDRVATIGFEGNYFGRGALSFVVKEQGSGTAAEAMRLTPAGNVGIGTSAPTTKLMVEGTASFGTVSNEVRLQNAGTFVSSTLNAHLINSDGTGAYGSGNLLIQPRCSSGAGVTNIVFATSNNTNTPTERFRITANGVTFNGDTAAANALDDYEEGTFNFGISFGGASVDVTYSARQGTYTKIGRQVTVNGYVELSSKGSSTGNVEITGLPFTVANNLSNVSAASLRIDSITFANQIQAYGNPNSTNIVLQEVTEAGGVSSITNSDFANNSNIMVTLTYFV